MFDAAELGPDQLAFLESEAAPRSRISRKAAARHQRRQERKPETEEPSIARLFEPLNERQAHLMNALQLATQVFAIGPAGTGKTYVAARSAIRKLIAGKCERIVVARPAVSKPKHRLGFRPGNSDAKIGPWLVPVMDGFKAEVSAATLDKMRKNGQIEFLPFEEMRGRSLSNAIVVLDEAQNCDLGDLKMFLTRIGGGSQVVVCGDVDQVDIPDSGLPQVLVMIKRYGIDADVVEFSDDDVVRSGVAKQWVKAFRAETPFSLTQALH